MKNIKLLLVFMILFTTGFANAQIGIGTPSPNPASVLDLTASNKALLLPRVANTAAIVSPANGMMIYDISAGCVKGYENGAWSSCLSVGGSGASVVADCNTNGFVGSYANGVAMTAANKFSVTITNNTFSAATISFVVGDLVLSGVSGITVASVSPTSATLNSGQSQLVEYTLGGTPTSAGTLTGTWTKGTLNCVKTVSVIQPAFALNCAGATNNGALTSGAVASGVSSVISYVGGNGSAHSGQTVTSTGVTGLTATLAAGNFTSGAGSLTYTITGTPASAGTASFAINIGGQTCTLTRTVATNITIPATITLAQNRMYMVASVYDQDYLPYTAPAGAATTNSQAANGVNEAVTVDVQGTITTTGVGVKIPVTATASGTLPAFTTTIPIPASFSQDAVSGNLTLSWLAQPYTAATTSIDATIAAVGGPLNAKKLDINAGIGNDALGVLMGTFTYPYNNAGNTTSYQVRDIAGIPDRNIADANHVMLYLPIVSCTGKIWLNNNLGADYNNTASPSFNPAQQGTSATDYRAYGSLFQWGRYSDGHELINWTSGTTGAPVYGYTTVPSGTDTPVHSLFITNGSDWRSPQNDALWQGLSGTNNPCPVGYRLATNAELIAEVTQCGITNSATAYGSVHKFVLAGRRLSGSASLAGVGSNGHYWSSTVSGTGANSRDFNVGSTTTNTIGRDYGLSVRCIKD